jgi:hypothetical protein
MKGNRPGVTGQANLLKQSAAGDRKSQVTSKMKAGETMRNQNNGYYKKFKKTNSGGKQ